GGHWSTELVRDERDEVGAHRREAAQLVDRPPLGLIGADVLRRGRDQPAEQADELDLRRREGILLAAQQREHARRPRPREQRSGDAAAEPEPEKLALFREAAR